MPHVLFAPEQFELVADTSSRLPDPYAPPAPALLLDSDIAAALANAVYDRNNGLRNSNNRCNTPSTKFVIDMSELGSSHFPVPYCAPKLPEGAGPGYRVHLPNAESDCDTWVINETFAFAFQRVLDHQEYSERPGGGVLLAYGAGLTAGSGQAGLAAGAVAISELGASPGIMPAFIVGGAVVGAAGATGLFAHDAYRRRVSIMGK